MRFVEFHERSLYAMFWNNFTQLCASKGLSPNGVAKELSISSGSVTKWKTGTIPQNGTLKKIAIFFDVSVDYLLGKDEQEKKPTVKGELTEQDRILLDAYHAQPEIQKAVDRLLGIEDQRILGTERDGKVILFKAAASQNHQATEIVEMDAEKWKKIKESPKTDDSLL